MGKLSFLPAFIGFWVGVLFLLLLDHVIPHLHVGSNQAEGPKSRLGRTTMMVLAVTLHNIPEGMAVGVMYAGFPRGERTDHGGKRTCPVPWHRHSEFPRGVQSSPCRFGRRAIVKVKRFSAACFPANSRAYRRGADASCRAACDPGAALSFELCRRCHALCGGGGTDS